MAKRDSRRFFIAVMARRYADMCTYCGQQQLEERVGIAKRDRKPEDDVLAKMGIQLVLA